MTTRPAASPRAILSAEERAMLAAYVEEQTEQGQVPFNLAARLTGLPDVLLRKLVRDGVLRGEAPWRARGVVGTCDIAQAREIAARLNAARAPVEGNGILATEAAEKYGFHINSIYNWHDEGWVHLIGDANKQRDRLFNEGDIAFARAIVDLTGHAPGKKVFPSRVRV
jgi:hypothetical protein